MYLFLGVLSADCNSCISLSTCLSPVINGKLGKVDIGIKLAALMIRGR